MQVYIVAESIGGANGYGSTRGISLETFSVLLSHAWSYVWGFSSLM